MTSWRGRTPDEAEEHRRPVTPRVGEVAADDARGDRRDAEAGEDERGLGGSRTELADEEHAEEGHREAAEPVDAPGGDEDPQLGAAGTVACAVARDTASPDCRTRLWWSRDYEGGVTGQMRFDSHVERLLDATVALVNLASPGEARGTAYDPPAGGRPRPGRGRRDVLARPALAADGRGGRRARSRSCRRSGTSSRPRTVTTSRRRPPSSTTCSPDGGTPAARPRRGGPPPAALPRSRRRLRPRLAGRHRVGPGRGHRQRPRRPARGVRRAGCDRVYVDGSKNGTRRYCSARCQSRVKAAAHRARTR